MKIKVPNPSGEGELEIDLSSVKEYAEAIKSAKAEAAKAEKDKLYKQLEDSKMKILTLEQSLKTNSSEPVMAQTPTSTLGDTQTNKPMNTLSEERVAELIAQGITKAFSEKLPEALKPINEALIKTQQETLSEFRERRIKELGSEYTPFIEAGFIKGSSKEEVEASIKSAKVALEGIMPTPTPPPVQSQVTPIPGTTPISVTPPPAPPVTTSLPPVNSVLESVKNMTPEEYRRNRESILAAAKNEKY
jgi:hypothetical protein